MTLTIVDERMCSELSLNCAVADDICTVVCLQNAVLLTLHQFRHISE